MNNAAAYRALKRVFPKLTRGKKDAFGSSPSGNGWMAVIIPLPYDNLKLVEEKAKDLGIKLYDPIVGSTYGYHRLINMDHQENMK